MAKTEKPFDSVRMMREIRDRLDREMEHMTSEERIAYINGRAERARAAREAASGDHARVRTA